MLAAQVSWIKKGVLVNVGFMDSWVGMDGESRGEGEVCFLEGV